MLSTPRRQHAAWTAIGALVVASIVFGLVAAISSRTSVAAIRACTTPGQDCYERGRAQTASAVEQINLTIIYANVCAARGISEPRAMKRCVWRLIHAGRTH